MNLEDRISKLPISKEHNLNSLIKSGLSTSPPLDSKASLGFLEEIIRKGEEQKNLEALAKGYVREKHENYLIARSIVIDVHLSLEFSMNWVIKVLLYFGAKNTRLNISLPSDTIKATQNIEYRRKYALVSTLGVFSKNVLSIFDKVNNLRNAFAHGDSIESARYSYDGTSIFLKKTIDKLVKDEKVVSGEFSKFLVRAGYLKK